ncbi:MAG: aspartate/glutamate racemase family protein [Alphaproteobacteria bacterium]|jgi:glutamate racemase|uniref:Glutamate racemase n=1 Tax=Brevundimonas mediterranea TaxID=74329 RepID=A0A6G7EIN4_9CAUL|nr:MULTISPECIES: aspartate/glutamate racemase family protein [Brevundimonas]MBU1271340.1 aspartate/glutamate racemase family protein [Alphaproteobacteria bacterium]OGN47745.1 MAG: glutamate racemase [Caulobacterales bacterium RIFCSPHIGHO2_12_FULL_68_13]OYX80046.1 MAG: glutamate racemase [Brevundimonas sp. 32-68-21]EDX80981.1 Asp/Glu/Hydantoin racemase superfamily [Brevundimonas sp. BAL3]KDP94504.1 glutamate racemase [Brevundimonas sp. EAKA]
MAIGVFDSGVGGLTVHRELTRRFPQRDFVYLADQAHAPYGGRGGEDIVELTRAGCERLFEAGASVVVLACNTASAIALRRLQQTWIPGLRERLGRPVNVLGIIVPTIEAATGKPWSFEAERAAEGDKVEAIAVTGVFCTAATAISRVFEIEIDKRREDIAVFSEPCPGLAGLIELGAPREELKVVVDDHVDALRRRIGRHPDKAILGCTHYEIIAELFASALPAGTVLINQPTAVADALERYFARHPEFELGDSGRRDFLTTGQAGPQSEMVSQFWGAPLAFAQA